MQKRFLFSLITVILLLSGTSANLVSANSGGDNDMTKDLVISSEITVQSEVSTVNHHEPNYGTILTSANPDAFISKWDTRLPGTSNKTQIKLPLYPDGYYDFVVDWGDGATSTIKDADWDLAIHNYDTEGIYNVTITGTLEGFWFGGARDKGKLIEISQWGNMSLGNYGSTLWGAKNLVLTATDAPDLSKTTTLASTFKDCINLGSSGDMSNWDISTITDMDYMFSGATSFNQDISSWNVTNVERTGSMFSNTPDFNQNLSSWDVSNVYFMSGMFEGASSFNYSLASWDVSKVTHMGRMFAYASSYNQPMNDWITSSLTTMNSMFMNATSFNQDISKWDTSLVYDFRNTFENATSFNQPINIWVVSNVWYSSRMFKGATSFDQPLGSWNFSKNDYMVEMFTGATLSIQNYDNLLEGWSNMPLKYDVEFHAGNSHYTNASARQYIIDNFGWTIHDAGMVSKPSAPQFVEQLVRNESVQITWDKPSSDGNSPVTEYRIYRSTTQGANYIFLGSTDTQSYLDLDINAILTYYYIVTAVNEAGESQASNEVMIEFIAPSITRPDDVTYESGSMDNEVVFDVQDLYPGMYNGTMDGSIYIRTTPWTNGLLYINIDGLDLGTHNLTLYIFDVSGNMAISSISITVIDTVLPEIDSPPDYTYEYGSEDQNLVWKVKDLNPDSYNVTLDGETYATNTWTSGEIVVDVSGLNVGTYIFKLQIFDRAGNMAFDIVSVTVTEIVESNPDTEILSTPGLDLPFLKFSLLFISLFTLIAINHISKLYQVRK